MRNLIAITETTNATVITVSNTAISVPVKHKPNLTSFNALAPNITGIERKNEYSAATYLDVPRMIAPRIVAPEREVPGINEST
ncbi:hypothetical protein DSECCO2_485670 [anaerobic digester metagenome]